MVPLNRRLAVPELEYILGDSTPKLLVHDKAFATQAAELAQLCKIAHLLEIDHDRPDSAYERALASAAQPRLPPCASITTTSPW